MSVTVSEKDFDIAAEIAALTSGKHQAGAVATFTGVVRGGDDLVSMTLEHYPGMTEAELERIEKEAHARWPLIATRIIHRVGTLKPGENIVLVIAVSSHRHAAFDAASFLMDYLKTAAPFWKKETNVSGSSTWVDARETDEAAIARWSSTPKAAE
jgi:molybdopterin synthase catalytic subunit